MPVMTIELDMLMSAARTDIILFRRLFALKRS